MEELTLIFKALSDETRLRIVKLLEKGELCVCDIVAALDIVQPKASFHLGVLKEAGLVIDQPVGSRRVYYIDPDGLGALRAWLDQFWTDALVAFKNELEREAAGSLRRRT